MIVTTAELQRLLNILWTAEACLDITFCNLQTRSRKLFQKNRQIYTFYFLFSKNGVYYLRMVVHGRCIYPSETTIKDLFNRKEIRLCQKNLEKAIVGLACIGAAAGAVIAYLKTVNKCSESLDDDFDDFSDEFETGARNYTTIPKDVAAKAEELKENAETLVDDAKDTVREVAEEVKDAARSNRKENAVCQYPAFSFLNLRNCSEISWESCTSSRHGSVHS